jgi:hypothetical protein
MRKSQRVVVLILFALVLATLAPAFCRQPSGFKDGFAGGGFGGGGGSAFLASTGSRNIAGIWEWLLEEAAGWGLGYAWDHSTQGSFNGQGPAGGGGGGGFPNDPQACRPEDKGCGNSGHGGGGGF